MAEDQENMQEEFAEMLPEGGAEEAAGAAAEAVEVPEESAEDVQVEAFPAVPGKAESDLAQARASVSKVAFAEEQLKDLMGGWFEESDEAVTETVQVAEAEAITGTPAYEAPAAEAAFGQPEQAGVQPGAQAVPQPGYDPSGQPVQAAAPAQGQPAQPAQPAAQDYWRGFQPVPPAQPVVPVQQGQPMPGAQPHAYGQPLPGAQAQAYGQPVPGAQPQPYVQPVPSAQSQPYGQPAPAMQPPVQPAPGPQAQPYGQPVPGAQAQAQPVRSAQPYGQPAPTAQPQPQPQPQAQYQPQTQAQPQPAGYSQAYTPQIQQPAGYVPAQDFTVQPQPATPAYAKSNRSTLAIVVVVVVALLAIIAAIVMGRILASAGEGGSDMIDQLNPTEQLDSNDSGKDGNGGGAPDGGSHGQGGEGKDQWGFNWDEDSQGGTDDQSGNNPNGVHHIYGGGVEADDGELHDAWNKSVSYSYTEGDYSREGIESMDFYGKTIGYDFDVEYPQLTGNIPKLEEINKTIRDTAMAFVIDTYENPTSQARELLEANAVDGYGVPKAVDAILESDVDYAISYNNEDFISICFSDEYAIGSWTGSYVALRTVNVNLKTGEVYTLDDVLNINDEIAEAFIDNLAKYDGGTSEQAAGRDSFIGALQGKGSEANNVTTTFYIDGNGKVNFGATYHFANNEAVARGWWDYTLTDEQLKTAKKDSSMWDCIK